MEPKKNNPSFGQCRCCLTKGKHRDIMKEYYPNGIREVYFDIFRECFNLFLSTDMNLSTLICASCVQRLRAASSFRKLAERSEQHLLDAARANRKQTIFVNVPVEDQLRNDLEVKMEQLDVKLEPSDADENVMVCVDFDDDYVAEDYEEYEPKVLSKITATELVEGEADLLARFPPEELKPLPTRRTLRTILPNFVKHLNMLKDTVITPKTLRRLLEENDLRRPPFNPKKVFVTEKMAQIINASTLIEYSNLTPFRSKGRLGFPCFYCKSIFENIDTLRDHTKGHKHSEILTILRTFGAESLVVYADINNLTCNLCSEPLPNLNELKSHLIKIHQKKMHLDVNDRVIPFKLSTDLYECQLCGFNFETFGAIERHMNVHFRNYVCKECGTGFVTKYRLKVHIKSMHVEGTFPCEICGKIFKSHQKHKNHVNTVHKMVKRFKCATCPERFTEYFSRQKHMVEAHGVAPLLYKCNVCDKAFDRRYALSRHLKRDHLEERDFQCEHCSYKCFTNNELRVHMVKHNPERIFECSVCKKSYARKKTLKEHMRIHNNDRRFPCTVCGQAFVQKCSLKGHLKTHHVEFSMT